MMNETLPKTWVEIKISELTKVISGGTPKTKIDEYFGGSIAWLTPADLSKYKNKYIAKGRRNITKLGLDKSSAKLLPKDSVLFSSRAPIGYTVIASNPICTNQGFKNLIPNEFYVPSYAYYYLKHSKGYIESQASGTTFREISGKKLGEVPFPLPPLAEQQRIVAKLDSLFGHLDVLKERLARIPELIKDFRQSVLTQAVTGKLTEEWREGKELGEAKKILAQIRDFRIKEYEEGCKKAKENGSRKPRKPILEIQVELSHSKLPRKWTHCSIGEIGDVSNGSTPSRKNKSYWGGNIPWVSSGLVQNCRIDQTLEYISEQGFINSSTSLLPIGTVLIAMIGEGKTRGQSAILHIEATINQNIAAIKINHGLIDSQYLFNWLVFNYIKNRQIGSGTGPKALNGQKVRELPFVLPPLLEQKEIVRRVESLFAKADAITARYETLRTQIEDLPQAILAMAFRGELVPQLPGDGNARELLEEIKRVRAEMEESKKKGKKTRKKK